MCCRFFVKNLIFEGFFSKKKQTIKILEHFSQETARRSSSTKQIHLGQESRFIVSSALFLRVKLKNSRANTPDARLFIHLLVSLPKIYGDNKFSFWAEEKEIFKIFGFYLRQTRGRLVMNATLVDNQTCSTKWKQIHSTSKYHGIFKLNLVLVITASPQKCVWWP